MMLIIWIILLAASLIGVISNSNFLQYNNIFNSFDYVEAALYQQAGYTAKGNYCILFICLLVFSFVMIMREYRLQEIKDKQQENSQDKDE